MKHHHFIVTNTALVCAFFRFLPHIPNCTPLVSFLLLAGIYSKSIRSLLYALLPLVVIDLLFYTPHLTMPAVYGAFALVFLTGRWVEKKIALTDTTKSLGSRILVLLGSAGASSACFFAITNGAVWLWSGLYPATLSGLARCYVLALPFWRQALVGDLVFTLLFFGCILCLSQNTVQTLLKRLIPIRTSNIPQAFEVGLEEATTLSPSQRRRTVDPTTFSWGSKQRLSLPVDMSCVALPKKEDGGKKNLLQNFRGNGSSVTLVGPGPGPGIFFGSKDA